MIESDRLVSLDAFRGLTIGAMVLVNNPGSFDSVYPPLAHAEWHGWTPTDLIFPFFLFIVGVAMAFSLPKQLATSSKPALYRKVLQRAAIIFALGLLLNVFPFFDFADLRVAGILQRIALVYLAASVIVLQCSRRRQVGVTAALLLGYWAAMMWIPVPGSGAGILTPDGSLHAWIDRLFLPGRIWNGIYDPEGLLGTIPATATTLIGVFTGYWIRSGRDRREIAGGMFTAGWALILAGLVWGLVFPINKSLWTSSYVLFTAGLALETLACCYWLIDVKGHRRWAQPAVVFGRNPIALFVLSTLMAKALYKLQMPGAPEGTTINAWLFETFFTGWAAPETASMIYAMLYVLLWWGLMALLYRKGAFFKV